MGGMLDTRTKRPTISFPIVPQYAQSAASPPATVAPTATRSSLSSASSVFTLSGTTTSTNTTTGVGEARPPLPRARSVQQMPVATNESLAGAAAVAWETFDTEQQIAALRESYRARSSLLLGTSVPADAIPALVLSTRPVDSTPVTAPVPPHPASPVRSRSLVRAVPVTPPSAVASPSTDSSAQRPRRSHSAGSATRRTTTATTTGTTSAVTAVTTTTTAASGSTPVRRRTSSTHETEEQVEARMDELRREKENLEQKFVIAQHNLRRTTVRGDRSAGTMSLFGLVTLIRFLTRSCHHILAG